MQSGSGSGGLEGADSEGEYRNLTDDPRESIDGIRALAATIAQSLARAGARDEALAVHETARRRLGIARPPRLRPDGRVWRLGALLLDPSGNLSGTGRVVRAEDPARRSILTVSAAEHRELQAAAVRGGFRPGETVNFDVTPIDLEELASSGSSGPLVVRGHQIFVRGVGANAETAAEFGAYLADRAELLLHPPAGA